MKVVPALLTSDIKSFGTQLHTLLPHFDRFSIDVQDGRFVSSKTPSTRDLRSYFTWNRPPKTAIFDFDLMTLEYESSIRDINSLAKHITIGSVVIHKALVRKLDFSTSENLTIGLALNPPDQIKSLELYGNLNLIPAIQIMTIYSGPQGQPFLPEMLNKIDELKKNDYRNVISLDGGINKTTIPYIISRKYRPDFICVGSYLSQAGNELEERIKYLKSIEDTA